METAILTKPEEAHVERMAGSFAEPSMSERFNEWATRTISEAKREEKKAEGKHRPREVKLDEEGRSDEEKKFIAAVAAKDESEKQPAKGAAEKDAAKPTEQRVEAKKSEKAPESNDSPVAPIANDRYWQRKFEGKEEHENHWRQVDSRAGVALQYINSHPQKEQIVQGFQAFVAGKPKAWQDAVLPDLYSALAEVASPGEVLRHIALQPEDRQALRQCKNAQELRAAVHTIAKHYPGSAPQASPKPRAPKPPSEVGGRGAAGDDRRETDFGSLSARMSQRYYGRHAE